VKRPRPLDLGLYGEVPALAVGYIAWNMINKGWSHGWLGDFRIFRAAGHALVHGHSPYVQPTVHLLSGDDRFVYPAPFALLFAPFNLLGPTASSLLYLVLSVAAIGIAVRMLGVTDWRCTGAAILGAGTYGSFAVGSVGPLLLLSLAAGWRYRDRAFAGILFALAAAAKIFLWPVLVWLVVTRRLRGASAAAATLAAVLGLWALLDLHGLREYPTTLRVLDDVERWKSFSPESLIVSLGGSASAAHVVAGAVAVIGIAALFAVRGNDRAGLIVAIAVALLATPLLWMHYLVLLVIPIALARPRLSSLWALPIVLWVAGGPESNGSAWRIVLALAVVLLATVLALPEREMRMSRAWAPGRDVLDRQFATASVATDLSTAPEATVVSRRRR
jgi:alpha-1,2-mannosyltransferase